MRAATVLCVVFAACGADEAQVPASGTEPERARQATAHGVTVLLPRGWSRARESLTPALTDPREVLSVATFPLRHRRTRCAHVPGAALLDLGRDDAFVTLQERGRDPGSTWPDFPPRPAHFGPALGGASEAAACVPSADFVDHWFGFTDGHRHFHVLVAFGPDASAAVRAQAWGILDRLRIDPSVRPAWGASG